MSPRFQSHRPGQQFPVGVTHVFNAFVDKANNTAFCNFSVFVNQGMTLLVFIASLIIQPYRRNDGNLLPTLF